MVRIPPSSTAATSRIASFDVALVLLQIGDVDHRFGRQHTTDRVFRTRTKRYAPASLGEGRRRIVRRDEVQGVAVPAVDISKLGVADADRILQHGCKHRLKIAGRAADNLEHLRGGGLLL